MTDKTSLITRQEARDIAEQASTKVLASFLLYLDVNHENHEDVKNLRLDLQYARAIRQDTDRKEVLDWAEAKRKKEIKMAARVEKHRTSIVTAILISVGVFFWEYLEPFVTALLGGRK